MSQFSEIVVKLKDENKKLIQDLSFERNLNNILENIRNNSLVLIQNCKCIENRNTFVVIKQFNSIYTELKAKQNLLKLCENQNQIPITESKSDDKNDDNFKTNSTIKAIQQKSVNVMKGKTRQTNDRKTSKSKPQNLKSNSNSSFSLITQMFNIRDRSSDGLSEMSDVLSVSQHKDAHNSSDFHCNECQQCFDTEIDLQIHVNRVHENSLSFVCNECQQIFNTFVELSTHSSQTHPPKASIELKVSQKSKPKNKRKSSRVNRQTVVDLNCCGRCHQRFNTKQLLLTHSSIVHNIPVFECDLCDYKTERKQTLFRHKEAMHSSDRPYKCPVIGCDKWFKTKHNISAHKKKVHFFFP